MDRARSKHALVEMCGLKRKLRFVEAIADSADALDPGGYGTLDKRVDLFRGTCAAGREVRVCVDKTFDRFGGHGSGTWLLFAHTMHPMAFEDIDSATRTQIEADLAEAAGRGINGSPADIVASFEEELADYLALPRDVQRAFPRGDTARIYGTALGEALVREGFSWQLLIDDYGTDLVVVKNPGGADEKYTAPLVVVDQRFEDEEPGKLTGFLNQFL